MGRPIQKKCLHCSSLSIEEAKALHGIDGDGCWQPKHCHRRRSHYRHRQDTNAKRRRLRRQTHSLGETLELNPPHLIQPPAALLVFYRQGANSPIHAVAAEIWQGEIKIAAVKPVHCMGLRGNEVTAYLQDVLVMLRNQFGIHRFEDVIKELSVDQCPIHPCPMKQEC